MRGKKCIEIRDFLAEYIFKWPVEDLEYMESLIAHGGLNGGTQLGEQTNESNYFWRLHFCHWNGNVYFVGK